VISSSLSSRMGAPVAGSKPRRIWRPASSGRRGRTSELRAKRPRSTMVRMAGMVTIFPEEATHVRVSGVKGLLSDEMVDVRPVEPS